MREWWSSPKIWSKSPLVAAVLLQSANVSQLWRMWTEWTAAGQSLVAWITVGIALTIYCNFYRVCTPDQVWARRMAVVGAAFNAAVVLTVCYFRFIAAP